MHHARNSRLDECQTLCSAIARAVFGPQVVYVRYSIDDDLLAAKCMNNTNISTENPFLHVIMDYICKSNSKYGRGWSSSMAYTAALLRALGSENLHVLEILLDCFERALDILTIKRPVCAINEVTELLQDDTSWFFDTSPTMLPTATSSPSPLYTMEWLARGLQHTISLDISTSGEVALPMELARLALSYLEPSQTLHDSIAITTMTHASTSKCAVYANSVIFSASTTEYHQIANLSQLSNILLLSDILTGAPPASQQATSNTYTAELSFSDIYTSSLPQLIDSLLKLQVSLLFCPDCADASIIDACAAVSITVVTLPLQHIYVLQKSLGVDVVSHVMYADASNVTCCEVQLHCLHVNMCDESTIALQFQGCVSSFVSILVAASTECICSMLEQRVWHCLSRLYAVNMEGNSVVAGGGRVEVLCALLLEQQAKNASDISHVLLNLASELVHVVHTANMINGVSYANSLQAVQQATNELKLVAHCANSNVDLMTLSQPMCFGDDRDVLDVREFKLRAMLAAVDVIKCIHGAVYIM